MPKFLDAPSWYDEHGNLTTINEYAQTIVGTTSIKYNGGGSYSKFPYCQGPSPVSDLWLIDTPSSNSVDYIRWNGAPQWAEFDKTYVYRGRVYGDGAGTLQCLFFTNLTPIQNNIHFSTEAEAVACTVILPSVWETEYLPYEISTVPGMGSGYYLHCIRFDGRGTSNLALPSSWWSQYCIVDQTVATYVKTE